MVTSFFTVTFPKYSPATARASKPETPKEFASTTEPNTVATVSDVSEKGSFINGWNPCVAAAIANPIPTPPKKTTIKCIAKSENRRAVICCQAVE